MNLLLVGIGGGVGAVLRYLLSRFVQQGLGLELFPIGTLTVNAIGCFLIGLLATLVTVSPTLAGSLRELLIPGILGGFTTFSAFGLETVTLVQNSAYVLAAANVLLSVALGIAGVFGGMALAKFIGS